MNYCVMCKREADYIAKETHEPLCANCMAINERIKEEKEQNK